MTESIKVLIVDDEDQFRTTTKRILDKRGFDTIVAATGEQAVEMMSEKPDVVILDIKMPGMDGHEALDRINNFSPDTPVIMLTGHGAEPSAIQARDQGAFDYLAKPCSMDLLAAKIADAHRHARYKGDEGEKLVKDVMIPVSAYSTLDEDSTVSDAVATLRQSFSGSSTTRFTESGHVSLLVLSPSGRMQGMLTIMDIFQAIMPGYLSAPKPSTADSVQYSPMFWKGIFTTQIRQIGQTRIKDIMSPAPVTIDENANLMEAIYAMLEKDTWRLAVIGADQIKGIIRRQDLLFEISRILSE